MVGSSEDVRIAIVREALRQTAAHPFDDPPPLMARKINCIMRELSGVRDPYLDAKDKSAEVAKELLAWAVDSQDFKSCDPFEAAVRLSIAGNIIDYGVDFNFKIEDAHSKISGAFREPIDLAALDRLRKAISAASEILFISDNCGEAVFDRLLIELFKDKAILAVRGEPILNDLTRREIEASALTGLPGKGLVDTGDCTPGISLRHSSQEFIAAFNRAPLIIAKGQGNFETLSDTRRPIAFLFRAKCDVVCKFLGGASLGSYQVLTSNLP